MKRVHAQNEFERDVKRLRKRRIRLGRLYAYITLLREGRELPPVAYPHKLKGEYKGLWECHIEGDWLLIYNVTPDTLILYRTGPHSDLF